MGRKKQPLSVVQGKGKSHHLTKDEIERRKRHEESIKGDTDQVKAPERLLVARKRDFDNIAAQLMKIDLMSNLDVDTLARYIDAKFEYERIEDIVRKLKPLDDVDVYTKLQRAKKSLSDECRSYASDLGLTITSRLKLVIPKGDEEPKESKWNKFGAGNSG